MNGNIEEVFNKLKQTMISSQVLALPNFQQPSILETDASGTGVGVVLHYNSHLMAYFSKKLAPRMKKDLHISGSCWASQGSSQV